MCIAASPNAKTETVFNVLFLTWMAFISHPAFNSDIFVDVHNSHGNRLHLYRAHRIVDKNRTRLMNPLHVNTSNSSAHPIHSFHSFSIKYSYPIEHREAVGSVRWQWQNDRKKLCRKTNICISVILKRFGGVRVIGVCTANVAHSGWTARHFYNL